MHQLTPTYNYYPFGLRHNGYNNLQTGTQGGKFRFVGKELDDELGLDWYDFGARNYDVVLGKWINLDPLAEVSRRWAPYNYAYNNPIYFIDPDGMLSRKATGTTNAFTSWDEIQQRLAEFGNEEEEDDDDDDEQEKGIQPITDENKDNISEISWGETSGLYPVCIEYDKEGKPIKQKYSYLINTSNWNDEKINELLKARAAIELIGSERNTSVHKDSPDLLNPIQKTLAAYHLKDNFPSVDNEISDDPEVEFYYISSNPNAKTPSISSKYWDQKAVKIYGPFYNIGGGDAQGREQYIIL